MQADELVVRMIEGTVPVPADLREFVDEYRGYDSLKRSGAVVPRKVESVYDDVYDFMVSVVEEGVV